MARTFRSGLDVATMGSTLNIYSHITADMQREAADALEVAKAEADGRND